QEGDRKLPAKRKSPDRPLQGSPGPARSQATRRRPAAPGVSSLQLPAVRRDAARPRAPRRPEDPLVICRANDCTREAPRLRRGAKRGGCGGPCRGPPRQSLRPKTQTTATSCSGVEYTMTVPRGSSVEAEVTSTPASEGRTPTEYCQ